MTTWLAALTNADHHDLGRGTRGSPRAFHDADHQPGVGEGVEQAGAAGQRGKSGSIDANAEGIQSRVSIPRSCQMSRAVSRFKNYALAGSLSLQNSSLHDGRTQRC